MKINNLMMIMLNSPWPIMFMLNLMIMFLNLLLILYMKKLNLIFLFLLILMINYNNWNNNLFNEMALTMNKSINLKMSFKPTLMLIVLSELMFFSSMFYVHLSMLIFNNSMFILKFNLKMFKLNFLLSLNNLIILLSSSMTIMIFINMNISLKIKSINYLLLTMILGMYFLSIQVYEYNMINMNISNTIFFSNFFLLTFFHMSHVMIGLIFLTLILIKKITLLNLMSNKVKIICWYWHFIDMIWIMIFFIIY